MVRCWILAVNPLAAASSESIAHNRFEQHNAQRVPTLNAERAFGADDYRAIIGHFVWSNQRPASKYGAEDGSIEVGHCLRFVPGVTRQTPTDSHAFVARSLELFEVGNRPRNA